VAAQIAKPGQPMAEPNAGVAKPKDGKPGEVAVGQRVPTRVKANDVDAASNTAARGGHVQTPRTARIVRTVAEVRHAFSKYGGNMGTEGSVAFQFKHCGQFVFAPGTSEDKVMEVALEAGAEDVITGDDGSIEVLCAAPDFESVKAALEAAGLKPDVAEVTMRAENPVELAGDDAARMQKLLDVIEDLDDVQDVFHNALMDE
jgi:hypothetical protein